MEYLSLIHHKQKARQPAHDYLLCAYLLDKRLDDFAHEVGKYYKVDSIFPKHYREALILHNHLRSHPVVEYHDNVLDADYKDFKDFLVREKFEYKSFSEESVEDLIEVAKTEKYYDNISKDIETLLSKLKQDKDRDLERYRDEVTRWIVSYIMPRYFYEKGSIMFSINYDEEVKTAIEILKDEKRYNEILSPKK